MTGTGLRRVFFALFPPPEVAEHLIALGHNLAGPGGGRMMRLPALHLTLAFVGSVSSTQIDELIAVGERVKASTFDLCLDRLGFWPCGGVLWAGCRELTYAERRLLELLRDKLQGAGFAVDQQPHVPHVTLARRVRCAALPRLATPLGWHVNEFSLIESHLHHAGARYQTLATFQLDAFPRDTSSEPVGLI
jgi:2'-5' RNA ligase